MLYDDIWRDMQVLVATSFIALCLESNWDLFIWSRGRQIILFKLI